jgi:peptidoglycan/LPS O-acetylase OafA/YrhL
MPELDTIRGLAILGVLLYHGLYWKVDLSHFCRVERLFLTGMWTGRLGVDLFFVLSGFLITGILVDSRERTDYYKRFYVRRILRILPLYFAIIAVLALLKLAPLSFIVLSIFYLSNLTPLFGVPVAYPVLWSLAVEEHFYFVWPAAARILRNKALLLCSVFVILITPLFRLLSYFLTVRNGLVSFTFNEYTWNCLDELAYGAALALFLREYQPKRRTALWFAILLISVAVAVWIFALPYGIMTRHTPTGAALQVVPWLLIFTAIMILFLLIGTSSWKSVVQIPGLRFLGYISYGLYLIHLLIFALVDRVLAYIPPYQSHRSEFTFLLVRFIVAASMSIGVAFLSRKYFEERFLLLKDRFS